MHTLMGTMLGAFSLWTIMVLIAALFWLWMFIDVIINQREDKVVWLLVVFFLSFVGSLIYYFAARKKRLSQVA
jgi:hypothetical protein